MSTAITKGDYPIVDGISIWHTASLAPQDGTLKWGDMWSLVFRDHREAEMRDTHLTKGEALRLLRLAGYEVRMHYSKQHDGDMRVEVLPKED